MRGRDIVVVEDDNGMREALERVLQAAGYGTEGFCSAEAFLDDGGRPEADCFVMDIHLPGLSGFELCGRLTEKGSQAPVIFITAHDDADSRDEARACGAAAYLPKPFAGRRLVEVIELAIRETRT
jgi:FixJ family two-component response regulator